MKLLITSTATSATTKPSPQDPRSKEKFRVRTTASLATNQQVKPQMKADENRSICIHPRSSAANTVNVLHVAGGAVGLIVLHVATGTGRSRCRAVERVK